VCDRVASSQRCGDRCPAAGEESHVKGTLLAGGVALIASFGFCLGPGPAGAAVDCSQGVAFSSNKTLGANYEQTAGATVPCITISNGKNLDLNGKTITCKAVSGGADICPVAIKATGSSSVIHDTESGSDAGAIQGDGGAGRWTTGVEGARQVKNLNIRDAATGILVNDTKAKVQGNVIRGVGTCIDATINSNTGLIKNNFCEVGLAGVSTLLGFSISGQEEGGNQGPKVQKNTITGYDVGIYVVTGTDVRLSDNLFCGADAGADPLVAPFSFGEDEGNLCCDDAGHPHCAISPPYTLP